MNRRTFLKTGAVGATTCWIIRPLQAADAKPKTPSNDELLAQANERTEKHRKSDGVIVVRGTGGKPVAGANVKVEQVRHEFLFGCNFFKFGRVKSPEREEAYRQRYAALLNYATLGFYWAGYEPARGKPMYEHSEAAADWCRDHGITCKGHPLAWDHPAGSPRWLPDDPNEVQRLSTARVRDIVTRLKGRIDIWDVVNEPTDLKRFKNPMNTFANKLGAVPFTRLHLEVARQANPKATLLVNDYRTDPAFVKILEGLREDGKRPFDTIGIQSHMHGGGWPLARIWEVCDRFAKFNLPIHFTETTIVSGPRLGPGENWGATTPEGEAKQADYVPQFYTMLFAHPAVQALTWWDFADDGAWQGAAAGWLRKDMSPKPVYERLMALVKGDWWTKAEGRTNAHGELALRAFHGTHRVTAELPNGRKVTQEVRWQHGQPNRVVLRNA